MDTFKLLSGLGDTAVSRRQFFRLGACASLAAVAPMAYAKVLPANPLEAASALTGERALSFYQTHTGESLRLVYWAEGDYLQDSLLEIKHLLRDHRNDEERAIDPLLLDLLHRIRSGLDTAEPFNVISGYRSPATNNALHARSHGVASHSLHMEGMAIDIRIPGRDLKQLKEYATALRGGGVGYYPDSDFVHVDVGRVRYW